MSLVVGSNSYVTVLEADEYLTNRIGADKWFTLPDTPLSPGTDSKESFLITSYNWLTGSSALDLPSTSDNQKIKEAQIEASLYLLEYYEAHKDRQAKQAQGVESFTFSKRSEGYTEPGSSSGIPANILGLLAQWQTSQSFFNLKGQYDV